MPISDGAYVLCCSGSGSVNVSSRVVSSGWEHRPGAFGGASMVVARPLGRSATAARSTMHSIENSLRYVACCPWSTDIVRCIGSSSQSSSIWVWGSCGRKRRRWSTGLSSRTPATRRAGCEIHQSGSVRGAPGQPGVPTRPPERSVLMYSSTGAQLWHSQRVGSSAVGGARSKSL